MKLYYCRGERYSDRVRQGLCGGFGVIEDFIQWLYGRENIEYFSGWKDKEIIDYMKKNSGKNIDEYNGFPGCWSIKKELVANNVSKPDLQHSEPNCNIMLKNPEDFNTSDGNVKGDDR